MTRAEELFERVGRVGPYFAVRYGGPAPAGFRPLRELYSTEPGSPLAVKIAAAAVQLRTAEPRVAASVVHLGLAARLWSVALGAAVLGGAAPDLDPDRAHHLLPPTGPLELWLPGLAPVGADLAAELRRTVLDANLAPLAAAVRAVTPVSARLLDGNAASALAGTARMLGRSAEPLARELLGRSPLHFRRTSCCLYYRVPGGGLCGDCVFDRRPPGVRETARPADS
ncbi:(2Fe-2S)-binding protein [Kitasatospora cinereorecta]|uniref:(2Fe-2S)-binding protein n=1 Tax=Kitasatospora cinereorecta TaxID=285560 RepID=A0ABW0V9D1_9ACTN